VTAPAGVSDPDDGNDSATDSDLLAPQADLSITKDDGRTGASPGGTVTYEITVANAGPSDVTGATVSDAFPADLTGCAWTCTASGSASCSAGGSGNLGDSVDLPVGTSVVYTATCTVDSGATGTLENTATVAVPSGTTDPEDGNDSATDADTLGSTADVSVTKDDGETTVVPGQTVTYTVTVANAGPSDADDTSVTDAFPAELEGVTWTCAAAGGASCTAAGSGDIAESVDLPAGSSVVFTATGTVAAGALGELVNTATAEVAAGIGDLDSGNDSATDTDEIFVEADLRITKTDNQLFAEPGEPLTWVITVVNQGPRQVTDAVVSDDFPAAVQSVTWTCSPSGGATCAPGPQAGDLEDLVFLPPGAGAVYTATATLAPSASGTLANTATVAAPAGVTDPDPSNDSAADESEIGFGTDLAIVKTDGSDTAVIGAPKTYALTVTNNGPNDAVGARVIDELPPEMLGTTWTCEAAAGASCEAAGSGDLNELVDIPVGGSAVFRVTGTVDLGALGTLSNTAEVVPPGELFDPVASNNTSTDDSELRIGTDLTITKSDGLDEVPAGGQLTYTIAVENLGPTPVVGATVEDVFPPQLIGCSWSCVASGGGSCFAGTASGVLVDEVDLPVGATLTYTATCVVAPNATGTAYVQYFPDCPRPSSRCRVSEDCTVFQWADTHHFGNPGEPFDVEAILYHDTYDLVVNVGPGNPEQGTASTTGIQAAPSTPGPPYPTGIPSSGLTYACDTADSVPDGTAVCFFHPDPIPDACVFSDLVIDKVSDAGLRVPVGSQVVYTVSMENDGPDGARHATVTDVLAPGVSYVSDDCGAGPPAGSTWTWTETEVPAGSLVACNVTVEVVGAPGGSVDNSASVTLDNFDPDLLSNVSDTVSFQIGPFADLGIDKQVVMLDAVGREVVYSLTVSNAGPAELTDAVVTDEFPIELVWVSDDCGAGPPSATTLTWDVGTLASGASLTCEATFEYSPFVSGKLVNTATADAVRFDTVSGNDQSSAEIMIVADPAAVFGDGFESGDISAWDAAAGGS
jgi:uncharacterized repeat protein (TIGR01451 family)